MAAAGQEKTVSDYIVHHLTNLTYGKLPEGFERYDGQTVGTGGEWTFAHGAEEIAAMGFNAVHVDSLAWSIGLALSFAHCSVGLRFARQRQRPQASLTLSKWLLSLLIIK